MSKPIPESTRRGVARAVIEHEAAKRGVTIPQKIMEQVIDRFLDKNPITLVAEFHATQH